MVLEKQDDMPLVAETVLPTCKMVSGVFIRTSSRKHQLCQLSIICQSVNCHQSPSFWHPCPVFRDKRTNPDPGSVVVERTTLCTSRHPVAPCSATTKRRRLGLHRRDEKSRAKTISHEMTKLLPAAAMATDRKQEKDRQYTEKRTRYGLCTSQFSKILLNRELIEIFPFIPGNRGFACKGLCDGRDCAQSRRVINNFSLTQSRGPGMMAVPD